MGAQGVTTAKAEAYDGVLGIIRSGNLSPGDRLPNEREIASSFGLGRGVVRDALTRMQAEGLIERRIGSGTYLAQGASQVIEMMDAEVNLERNNPMSFYDMIEARLMFEPNVVSIAAETVTDAQKASLRRQLRKVSLANTWLEFKEAIYSFHRMIYSITSNRLLLSVFDTIHKARRDANFDGRNLNASVAAIIRNQATADLEPILEAISDGDGKRAAKISSGYLMRLLAGR